MEEYIHQKKSHWGIDGHVEYILDHDKKSLLVVQKDRYLIVPGYIAWSYYDANEEREVSAIKPVHEEDRSAVEDLVKNYFESNFEKIFGEQQHHPISKAIGPINFW